MKWATVGLHTERRDAQLFSAPALNITIKRVPFMPDMPAQQLWEQGPAQWSLNCPTVLQGMTPAPVVTPLAGAVQGSACAAEAAARGARTGVMVVARATYGRRRRSCHSCTDIMRTDTACVSVWGGGGGKGRCRNTASRGGLLWHGGYCVTARTSASLMRLHESTLPSWEQDVVFATLLWYTGAH